MNDDTRFWVGIVISSGIAILMGIPGWLLALPQLRQTGGASGRKLRPIEFERLVPLWAQRLVVFIVQTLAIYELYNEYLSTEPITRSTLMWVAFMTSVVTICFILPLVMGVYRVIERYSEGK